MVYLIDCDVTTNDMAMIKRSECVALVNVSPVLTHLLQLISCVDVNELAGKRFGDGFL